MAKLITRGCHLMIMLGCALGTCVWSRLQYWFQTSLTAPLQPCIQNRCTQSPCTVTSRPSHCRHMLRWPHLHCQGQQNRVDLFQHLWSFEPRRTGDGAVMLCSPQAKISHQQLIVLHAHGQCHVTVQTSLSAPVQSLSAPVQSLTAPAQSHI